MAGLYIASFSSVLAGRWSVKVVGGPIARFAPPELSSHGPVIAVPVVLMRLLKPLFGLAQLPVVLQDPNGLAFRLSSWRRVLSDGLLTEFLIANSCVNVKRFYSLRDVVCKHADVRAGYGIIGSNWLEHGAMSVSAYRRHLQFLCERYPDANYYCHPKERSSVPEEVFGAAHVRRLCQPVETHLWKEGIPQTLIGVCSSSLLNLALGRAGRVCVELIVIPAEGFDGVRGDTIEVLRVPVDGRHRISVGDIQTFLKDTLEAQHVTVSVRAQQVA